MKLIFGAAKSDHGAMNAARWIALLSALLVGAGMPAHAAPLFAKPPVRWTVTVETAHLYRIQCHEDGYMKIETRFLYPKNPQYTLTIFKGYARADEARAIYDAAVEELQNFTFDAKERAVVADDNEVSVSLQVDQRTLTAAYPGSQQPPGIGRILDIGKSLQDVKWEWKDVPVTVPTDTPAKNRTAAAVREFFKGQKTPPSVKKLVKQFGRPEGFSTHFGASRETCLAYPGDSGGTLRFQLKDGSELLVWTPDFNEIHFASRYGPKPDEEESLFLMPAR